MIKQTPVSWDKLSEYIECIGRENVVSVLPLSLDYSADQINTHHGSKSELVGNIIVGKYLLIYNVF